MSFLTALCSLFSGSCFTQYLTEGDNEAPRNNTQTTVNSVNNNLHTQSIVYQDGSSNSGGLNAGPGYFPVAPPPRYTPRPDVSVDEKTLEAHMRDPPISSSTYARDEKNMERDSLPNASDEVASDGSSAISFPSSYGNTSTATRETPPPPYSPNPSPTRSRPTSMEESTIIIPPSASHIPPPLPSHSHSPVFPHRDYFPSRFSLDERTARQRRLSWESR